MIRKVFICTDTSKLEELGFKYRKNDYLYSTNGQYRIEINLKRDNIISFIHHSYDTYSMFKKMIELGIVIETEKKIHFDSKIEELEKRINELERKIKDEKED